MNAVRVLVVEDDAIIGLLLTEQLAATGYIVCATVSTRTAAVAAAAHYRPDLIIVDAHLGADCGIATMEEILRTGPVAHLYITGDTDAYAHPHTGAVVLHKPFRMTELLRAMAGALQGKVPRTPMPA